MSDYERAYNMLRKEYSGFTFSDFTKACHKYDIYNPTKVAEFILTLKAYQK